MQFLALLVDLLKGIAWPAAIFGIVCLFRAELKDMLPRLRKAGPTGVEIESQVQLKVSRWSGELKELPGVQRTTMMKAVEEAIYTDLQNFIDDQRVDILVNRLALARLSSVFERIYGAIYGSQIAGLRALVANGGKVPLSDAVKYFDDVKSNTPGLSPVEFNTWIGFLRNFDLVRIEANEVAITDLGRDFLLYLSATNLAENRPL